MRPDGRNMQPAENQPYLVGLHLAGRRVLVAGGGPVAERRLPALLAAGADVEVVSPRLTPQLHGRHQCGEITWQARDFRAADLDGAWYALALTDSAAVNADVVSEARRRRIFCVRGDDAAQGDASTPATARHDVLQVGVLGGGDPRRAASLRDEVLEALQEGTFDVRRRRTAEPGGEGSDQAQPDR